MRLCSGADLLGHGKTEPRRCRVLALARLENERVRRALIPDATAT